MTYLEIQPGMTHFNIAGRDVEPNLPSVVEKTPRWLTYLEMFSWGKSTLAHRILYPESTQ